MVGVFLCGMVLATGAIWGKPIWGVYWSWDARLTTTLILRVLCTGDMPFFAVCLAAKTELAAGDVLALVEDGKADAVLNICKKAGLPPSVRRAIAAVLKVYAAAKDKQQALTPEVFTPKAVDRLVREYDEISEGTLDSMIAEICWRMI